jgi:hypothetical protein
MGANSLGFAAAALALAVPGKQFAVTWRRATPFVTVSVRASRSLA